MAILTEEAKIFIMKQLARGKTPQQIAGLVYDHFGIKPTRQQIWNFRPENGRATRDHIEIYDAARKEFLCDLDSILGFHAAYRLNILQDELDVERAKPITKRKLVSILAILRQMAYEEEKVLSRIQNDNGERNRHGESSFDPVECRLDMAFIFRNTLVDELNWDIERANLKSAEVYNVDVRAIIPYYLPSYGNL